MSHKSWTCQVRKRLAKHLRNNGSTDLRTTKLHRFNPLETYYSPARDRVARQAPLILMPSNILPPGHVVATNIAGGLSLLIHRDRESPKVLRGYLNRCRHRGSSLVKSNTPVPLKSSALTCPYHGWTYDVMTGNLKHVPGEIEGFPCLNKNDIGLKKMDCFESAGAIWLKYPSKDKTNDSQLQFSYSAIDSELSSLAALPTYKQSQPNNTNNNLLRYREWNINANWQLLVETFLESYHVKYLHNDTLGIVAHSNVMVTDVLDDYSARMTVPLKSFDTDSMGNDNDDNDDDDSFWDQTTTTYHLFPNAAISIFKRFILYLSIQPIGPDTEQPSTSSLVQVWGVPRSYTGDAETNERTLQERDMESVIRGIEEDWECAEDIQQGLVAQNGGDDESLFSYGRYEGNNVHFLRNVEKFSKL
jgi:phenylpropionate dioxygenase-like ring-hydroxylating dioxygenase large terminal subunit